MLVDLGVRLNVREWAPQHEEMHRQRAGGFRLQNQLKIETRLVHRHPSGRVF